MQIAHIVLVIVGIFASAAPSIEAAFPAAAAYVKIAATLFAAVATALGLATPALAPRPKAPPFPPVAS